MKIKIFILIVLLSGTSIVFSQKIEYKKENGYVKSLYYPNINIKKYGLKSDDIGENNIGQITKKFLMINMKYIT
jgi:hypothetical protein